MPKLIHRVRKHLTNLQREISKQMLTLATSAFGLIAALAWNEVIKEVVTEFIKPVLGSNSGAVSLLIYAVLVTILAVATTYYLTKLVKKN
ncbi:MAG TPA: DUF5654 family protein [Patescibacteria group bacterium]|nr:DUF5654 family protein [Patescibacteria group bacterium]